MKSLSVHIIVLIIGLSTMSFLKAMEVNQCKLGWESSGNSCFFFTNETQKKDFGDAERSCVELGGHLASCLTDNETTFIKEKLTKDGYKNINYWFGGIFQNKNNTQTNLDGTPINTGPSMQGLPTNYTQSIYGRCLYLKGYSRNGNVGISVGSYHCISSFNYICKSGKTSCGPKYECPSGWFQDIDECYTFNGNVSATLNDAVAYCQSKDGQLVEIGSLYEQRMLLTALGFLFYKGYEEDKYHIGAFNPSTLTLSDKIWCNSTIPTKPTKNLLIMLIKAATYCLKPLCCDDCANQKGAFACERKITAIPRHKC